MSVKDELEICLEKRQEIKEVDLKIKELREKLCCPKIQIISGMPKATGGGSGIDGGLIMLEKLSEKKKMLEREIDKKWEEIQKIDEIRSLSENQYEIIYLRFYKGMIWKDIVTELNKSSNQVFKLFKKIKGILEMTEREMSEII